MLRCINLDWLELFCREPKGKPLTPEYWRGVGFDVVVRRYGTPQYRMMYQVCEGKKVLFEVRRDPYSLRAEGGIFDARACHIRLSNELCYMVAPIDYIRCIFVVHEIEFISISRIDIALDFCRFDDGSLPDKFVRSYVKGRYFKICQSAVSAHGKDTRYDRVWNSIKWGSPSSPITTKLYNKSLELKQVEDKPYIRAAWQEAGLTSGSDVWRIEFSISAQMQTIKSKREGLMMKKSLSHYDSRERLLKQFFIFYGKYFDFREKVYTTSRNGLRVLRRKYDCPRVQLMDDADAFTPYTPARNPTLRHRPDKVLKMLANKCKLIADDDRNPRKVIAAAHDIYHHIMDEWVTVRMQLTREWAQTETQRVLDRQAADPDSYLHEKQEREEWERRVLKMLFHKYGYPDMTDDLPF